MRLRTPLAALALAGLVHTSCGGGGVADPARNVIVQFTGTIHPGQGAAGLHFFDVSRVGEVSVTLNSLTPTLPLFEPVQILLAAATTAHDQCFYSSPFANVTIQTQGKQSQPAIGNTVVNAGPYCVLIGDVGFFTVDEAYVITVSHP